MSNLQEVCKTLLNNADLALSIDRTDGSIKLEFYPAAFEGVITIYCADFSRLNLEKHLKTQMQYLSGKLI